MMQYNSYTITSAGITIDPNTGDLSGFVNPLICSASPITLVGNISIIPTTPSAPAYFEVRWEVDVTISTFTVAICSEVIAQDCVNQPGTFSCYYDGTAWTVQYSPDFIERPQEYSGVATVIVPTSGTLTLTAGVDKAYQRFSGSPTTLLGNYTVNIDTGAKDGSQFFLEIGGNVTLNSNVFTIVGLTIPQTLASTGGGMIIATYDATNATWRAVLINKDVALNNIAQIAGLSIPANATNSIGFLSPLTAAVDGGVLQRSGSTLSFSRLSSSNFGIDAMIQQVAWVSISSGGILNLFSAPAELLPAPAAGYSNAVNFFIVQTSYDGSPAVAYDTNIDLRFFYTGSSEDVATAFGILGFTSSFFKIIYPSSTTGSAPNILTAQPLNVAAIGGNPANGTGTINIGIVYSLLPPAPVNLWL